MVVGVIVREVRFLFVRRLEVRFSVQRQGFRSSRRSRFPGLTFLNPRGRPFPFPRADVPDTPSMGLERTCAWLRIVGVPVSPSREGLTCLARASREQKQSTTTRKGPQMRSRSPEDVARNDPCRLGLREDH